MKFGPRSLPTFFLFMRCYWNELGSEAYGTLRAALEEFCSDAGGADDPKEHMGKLLLEMREVRQRGFALKADGTESQETWEFWGQAGGRGLNGAEFNMIELFLEEKLAT